jgi:hypothetical protein
MSAEYPSKLWQAQVREIPGEHMAVVTGFRARALLGDIEDRTR